MKRPLSWHEECLRNMRSHLAEEEARLARMQAAVHDNKVRVRFAEKQLEEAKARGLDGYDEERFLRKGK